MVTTFVVIYSQLCLPVSQNRVPWFCWWCSDVFCFCMYSKCGRKECENIVYFMIRLIKIVIIVYYFSLLLLILLMVINILVVICTFPLSRVLLGDFRKQSTNFRINNCVQIITYFAYQKVRKQYFVKSGQCKRC